MTAVHGVLGTGGLLSVVMPMNGALRIRGATLPSVESPSGYSERSVEEYDRNETDNCDKQAPAALVPKSHWW